MKPEQLPSPSADLVTHARRLQFAVRFATLDLATLRPGDWLNVRDDLQVFLQRKTGQSYESVGGRFRPGAAVAVDAYARRLTVPLIDEELTGHQLSPDDVAALQAEVRQVIAAVAYDAKTITAPTPYTVAPLKVRYVLSFGLFGVAGPTRDVFLWHLLWLLNNLPPGRIMRCPECGTIFYRVKQQAHCSRACTNRVTQRRWRERHDAAAV